MKKKLLLFTFLLSTVFLLTGCTFNEKQPTISDKLGKKEMVAGGEVSTNVISKQSLSDVKDGVNINIDEIRREDGQTIVAITLNNHRYDLTKMNILSLSEFAGIKAAGYDIKGEQMGGHHLQADLVFPGELKGSLTIGLKDDLKFNFDIL